MWSYPVLDPVSQAYPEVQGRSPTCYSPVRHSSTPKGLSVRLACVKHAASVRPEPESNSPNKNNPHPKSAGESESEKFDLTTSHNWQSSNNDMPPNGKMRTQQKTTNKNHQTHY